MKNRKVDARYLSAMPVGIRICTNIIKISVLGLHAVAKSSLTPAPSCVSIEIKVLLNFYTGLVYSVYGGHGGYKLVLH